MISVLTLTYKRHHLLEEALESFLRQDFSGESELVIINDGRKPLIFDHPNVRIINVKNRFSSVGAKLKFGFSACHYDHVFRLDDDDLIVPWALSHTWEDIVSHPEYDIYRSDGHYYFEDNKFIRISDNVNNGNVYSQKYLSRIEIPDGSFGEDFAMTYQFNAKIYVSHRKEKTMIYRWGMNTYHVSGMGNQSNAAINDWTDRIVNAKVDGGTVQEQDAIVLHPRFQAEYFQQLNHTESHPGK